MLCPKHAEDCASQKVRTLPKNMSSIRVCIPSLEIKKLIYFHLFFQALLVISAVTLLASADKPSSVESKPVKTVPKVSKPVTKVVKSEAKEPKAPSVSTRQQKKYPLKPIPRKYPIHPSQFKSSRLHRLAKKFPVHKVLSNSVRQSRKFNAGPSKKVHGPAKKVHHGPAKKVQKIQRRKRIQKPVGQHKAHARVRPQEKSHNFARFLRAFGKQLNRPVL